MGMLLLKRGYAHCIRWLADHGMPKVNYRTLRSFKDNYMANLQQDVVDKLTKAILEEEAKQEAEVADSHVYGQLSMVQTYKRLLDQTEKQITLLEGKPLLTDDQTKILGQYYDRIMEYRKELSIHNVESEVEQMRRTVLREVSRIALSVMKGDEGKQNEFIQKVDEYSKRS